MRMVFMMTVISPLTFMSALVRTTFIQRMQVGKGIHGGRIVIRPKPELCAAEAEAPPLDLAAAAAAGAAGDAASAPSW